MSSTTNRTDLANDGDLNNGGVRRRLTTETKASFKTTELFVYLAAVVSVLVASAMVDANAEGQGGFGAEQAWFLVTLLTIGYMISRGLAKSGSRERYDA